MKHLQMSKEVLNSWRRCMERGMSNTVASPVLCLGAEALKSRLEESSLLSSVFEDCVKETDDLISGEYCFLLVAPDGILLKKKPGKGEKSRSSRD